MTGNDGFLPSDVLREILLRLPAKTLCRLRAVCRAWLSMLSHPGFVAAHESWHHAPHFNVAVINDDAMTMDFVMLDQSGNKIRRVPAGSWCHEATLGTHHHLASITMPKKSDQARLVDLESGAISLVPLQLRVQGQDAKHPHMLFLGRASTGEHKALLIRSHFDFRKQFCRVLTLGGISSDTQWRDSRQTPPASVNMGRHASAVVNGVMYFFIYPSDVLPLSGRHGYNMLDGIVSFDLVSERWSQTVLQGPLSSRCADQQQYPIPAVFLSIQLHLTALNGNLVIIHKNVEKHLGFCTMDLWFCTESSLASGKAHWLRRYSVYHGNGISRMMPLWELADGRLAMVAYPSSGGSSSVTLHCQRMTLRMYDPTTDTSADVVEMDHCVDFSTYTGSLLSYC